MVAESSCPRIPGDEGALSLLEDTQTVPRQEVKPSHWPPTEQTSRRKASEASVPLGMEARSQHPRHQQGTAWMSGFTRSGNGLIVLCCVHF
jgi:hypothetical protein